MDGSFSGKVSLEEKPLPMIKHTPIKQDTSDPRIDVLREYISKVPNATIQNLKTALTHFTKSTDEEFRNLIKSANPGKYDELYPVVESEKLHNVISTERIFHKATYTESEVNLLKEHIELPPRHFYKLYKQAFPNSERPERFVKDLRYLLKVHPDKYSFTNNLESSRRIAGIKAAETRKRNKTLNEHTVHHITDTNQQLVAQTIRSLYKAGFTPETLPKVKPVLNELMAQNSNQDEIALAIAFLKS